MVLSDTEIWNELAYSKFDISPLDPEQVQPASIDLRLRDKLKKQTTNGKVTVSDESTYPDWETVERMTIRPGEFLLGSTVECVNLPDDICGTIYGRSSIGRLGLFIHNAGFVDSGFCGDITLELYNAAEYPIQLERDMGICQIALHKHSAAPRDGYKNRGKYQNQEGVTESRLHEDFE